MVTEMLVSKVREKIAAGVSEGVIKGILMSEGWPLNDIEEVMGIEMKGQKPVKEVVKKEGSVWQYVGFTLIGLLVALGGAYVVLGVVNKGGLSSQDSESQVINEQSPSVTPTPTEVAQASFLEQESILSSQDYIDQKDKYRIRPPKDWEIDTSGKLGAPVFFFGPEATASGNYVYKANINVMTGQANDNTLEGYVNFYLKSLGQKLEGFKVSEQRKIVVSGRNMMIIRNTFILDGRNFTGMSLILVDQDKVYVVTGTALTSDYARVKSPMDLSIYSFNLL